MPSQRRITIINGHPDSDSSHLCHALADAYARGAVVAGHDLRAIDVAHLTFPLIRNKQDFEDGPRPPDVLRVQNDIRWADHLVLVYPLWQGTMPALLKGLVEQVFRYDFAFAPGPGGRFRKLLGGRSARIIVTMGMPAAAYRLYFRAHSLKSLERNVLKFAGFRPVRDTLFGTVDGASPQRRARWLARAGALGQAGA